MKMMMMMMMMALTKLSGRDRGLKVLEDWILLSVTGLDVLACIKHYHFDHSYNDGDYDGDYDGDAGDDDAYDGDGHPLSGACCSRPLPVYPVPLKQKLPSRELLCDHHH